jgi:hypothetical protein
VEEAKAGMPSHIIFCCFSEESAAHHRAAFQELGI